MANRRSIISLPNERLRRRSRRVGLVDDSVRTIIADMISATLDWEDHREHEFGVALAAIQINKLIRIVVIRHNLEDKSDRGFDVFINPEIVKTEGKPEVDFEGCLSVQDIYGRVKRYPRVKVRALNEAGREVRVTAEGFLARVFQYEVDHTKGILFVDRIKSRDDYYRINGDGKLEGIDYDELNQNGIFRY